MTDARIKPLERSLAIAMLVACWMLCAASALTERVDRDEHMYLAAARLSTDLELYEDFAFLQTPYSVGVYRAVLALAPDPWTLLPARLFKTALTAAMIVLLVSALRRFGARPLLAAGLVTLVYMTGPTRDVATFARNYDLAQACILAGICILPLRRGDPAGPGRMILIGLLSTCAVGFKLTYLPLAAVLIAWPVLTSSPGRGARAAWLGAGALAGSIPAAILMAGVDPAVLQVNLLDYHFLNAEFHSATGGNEPFASLLDRISRTLGTFLAREHRPLFLMTVFALALSGAGWSRARALNPGPPCWFAIVFLASAMVVAAVPRPILDAYFAPAFLGMALLAAAATGRLNPRGAHTSLALCLLIVAGTASMRIGTESALLLRAANPDNWTGVRTHHIGEELRAVAAPGLPVATTHPIYALEAGLGIYPELATGVFTWRAGALLGAERRESIRSVCAETIDALLDDRPAGAIVTGVDAMWDAPLDRRAVEQNWIPRASSDPQIVIWAP